MSRIRISMPVTLRVPFEKCKSERERRQASRNSRHVLLCDFCQALQYAKRKAQTTIAAKQRKRERARAHNLHVYMPYYLN